MKSLIYTLVCLIVFAVPASAAKREAPETGTHGSAYDFKVDGVKVIVEPTAANEVVAVTVTLQGGIATGEVTNPALPFMTSDVTTASGSVKYPKEKYREELSRLVTSIYGSADAYRTTYTLNCVKPKWDESWAIFEDVIKEPLYDATEIANEHDQAVADIAGRRADPDSWGRFLLDSIWSAGHPAGRVVEASDVDNITADAMRAFHDLTLERSRMLIVVVGNVTREDVEAKVRQFLEAAPAVPTGKYRTKPFDLIEGPGVTSVTSEARPLPTTYMKGRFSGPTRTQPSYWPTRLAISILNDRLYEEVRTKRNLSYAPFARFSGIEGLNHITLGASSTAPDSAIHVIVREVTNMRDNGVTEKELRDTKASYITEVYMSAQTNLAEANRLYTTELETGDYHDALRIPEYIDQVTLDQVRAAVAKYFHTILWTTVGDTVHIKPQEFLYP